MDIDIYLNLMYNNIRKHKERCSMINGNVNTYSSYGLSEGELDGYLKALRSIEKDEPAGMIQLDNGAYMSVQNATLSPSEGRRFEAHRRLIDIQFVLDGTEQIAYADLSALTEVTQYSPEKDVAFYAGTASAVLTLGEGDFAVFTPDDAHMPCIGTGTVKKIVIKVPVKEV